MPTGLKTLPKEVRLRSGATCSDRRPKSDILVELFKILKKNSNLTPLELSVKLGRLNGHLWNFLPEFLRVSKHSLLNQAIVLRYAEIFSIYFTGFPTTS